MLTLQTLAAAALISSSPLPARAQSRTGDYKVSSPAAGTPVTYHEGPVLSNVNVVSVMWTGSVSSTVTSGVDGFYDALVHNSYLDWLSEYNTATQSIGRGSYQGNFTISPQFTATTVPDANIGAELAAQINAGKLPTPTENTLYMVHFPASYTEVAPGGAVSCRDFCAYHYSST
ncbi:MAG TPA: hypothetical protein VF331_08980 [Polyangiales bacterium]